MLSKEKYKVQEASFTLFETVIALAIMSTMMIELAGLQGNVIYFSEYGSRVDRAVWLAERVLSQVEYQWRHRNFATLKLESKDEIPFEDYPDFKYRLNIREWKLPLFEILQGGGFNKDKDDKEPETVSSSDPSDPANQSGLIEQFFAGEPLLQIANVEIIWSEGAQKNSFELPLLLTNQKKIDELAGQQKDAYKKMVDSEKPKANKKATPASSGGPSASPGP